MLNSNSTSPKSHAVGSTSRGPLLLIFAVILLSLVPGCGYTHREMFPQEFQSISVPIFENKTFYQGYEFDVTEAVCKEIELRTPYKVTSLEGADTQLKGSIVSVNQVLLSTTSEANLPQELEYRIFIDFEWKNLRTGKVIRDRKGFEAVGRYVPTAGVNEFGAVGQHEAAQALATAIVGAMRADW